MFFCMGFADFGVIFYFSFYDVIGCRVGFVELCSWIYDECMHPLPKRMRHRANLFGLHSLSLRCPCFDDSFSNSVGCMSIATCFEDSKSNILRM